jgi:toxin ParE1/3/4
LKRYEVDFLADAIHDIDALFCYIAEENSLEIAAGYLARIERLCISLQTFPLRGTAVAGEVAGLRRMGFERRVTILRVHWAGGPIINSEEPPCMMRSCAPFIAAFRDERADGPGLTLRLKSWTADAPAHG